MDPHSFWECGRVLTRTVTAPCPVSLPCALSTKPTSRVPGHLSPGPQVRERTANMWHFPFSGRCSKPLANINSVDPQVVHELSAVTTPVSMERLRRLPVSHRRDPTQAVWLKVQALTLWAAPCHLPNYWLLELLGLSNCVCILIAIFDVLVPPEASLSLAWRWLSSAYVAVPLCE